MSSKRWLVVGASLVAGLLCVGRALAADSTAGDRVVRLAELEIDPAQLGTIRPR